MFPSPSAGLRASCLMLEIMLNQTSKWLGSRSDRTLPKASSFLLSGLIQISKPKQGCRYLQWLVLQVLHSFWEVISYIYLKQFWNILQDHIGWLYYVILLTFPWSLFGRFWGKEDWDEAESRDKPLLWIPKGSANYTLQKLVFTVHDNWYPFSKAVKPSI